MMVVMQSKTFQVIPVCAARENGKLSTKDQIDKTALSSAPLSYVMMDNTRFSPSLPSPLWKSDRRRKCQSPFLSLPVPSRFFLPFSNANPLLVDILISCKCQSEDPASISDLNKINPASPTM